MGRKYVTFRAIDKSPLNVSVPTALAKGFREKVKEFGLLANELLTYMLCDLLDQDPTDFGLFPLIEQGQDADRDDHAS